MAIKAKSVAGVVLMGLGIAAGFLLAGPIALVVLIGGVAVGGGLLLTGLVSAVSSRKDLVNLVKEGPLSTSGQSRPRKKAKNNDDPWKPINLDEEKDNKKKFNNEKNIFSGFALSKLKNSVPKKNFFRDIFTGLNKGKNQPPEQELNGMPKPEPKPEPKPQEKNQNDQQKDDYKLINK